MTRISLRTLIFWPHLVAGVLAGVVILIMSVTGVLLTYEKQMIAWADGRVAMQPHGRERVSPEALTARIAADAGARPVSLTIAAEDRPTLAAVSQKTLLVDPYSGAVLGESAPRLRKFFRQVTDWHRWLALTGERRVAGRAITGWANVVFFFIVASGIYLWVPRGWNQVRAALWFRRGLAGKARDFNWHNAIGIWSAVPLLLVVASAMPISFPWANALVYRIVGETPPSPPAPRPAASAPREASSPAPVDITGLNEAWVLAQQRVADWRTITIRVPNSDRAPFAFTIDRGYPGQPQHRGTLTVSRGGDESRWEPFAAQTFGRRVRSISRFTHTGEVLGLAGQTIAGLVTLGSVFLVWTGVALACRRLFAWRRRSTRERQPTSLAA